jgi:glyoxylase-like metal-dependent hydrolase (beta-lactamase superfamily II)
MQVATVSSRRRVLGTRDALEGNDLRMLLKIATGLALLVVLAAAVFLLTAHIQVRGVGPPLPDDAQLRALLSSGNGPASVRYINTSTQELPVGRLGHTLFLVEWKNGNLFMIDAGMDRANALEFGKLMETALGAEEAVPHGNIAELLGDDIERVVGVGFTHLHIDHTQGVVPFCERRGSGARVYQTFWQAELHNFNTEQGADIVAQSCLGEGELNGPGISTIDGMPGLGIVGLGGHTPGSTLFAIAEGDRLWLISGDTTNSKADVLSNTGKGFLYSYLMVPEDTARTEELRLWFARLDAEEDMTVVVPHDIGDIETSAMQPFVQ